VPFRREFPAAAGVYPPRCVHRRGFSLPAATSVCPVGKLSAYGGFAFRVKWLRHLDASFRLRPGFFRAGALCAPMHASVRDFSASCDVGLPCGQTVRLAASKVSFLPYMPPKMTDYIWLRSLSNFAVVLRRSNAAQLGVYCPFIPDAAAHIMRRGVRSGGSPIPTYPKGEAFCQAFSRKSGAAKAQSFLPSFFSKKRRNQSPKLFAKLFFQKSLLIFSHKKRSFLQVQELCSCRGAGRSPADILGVWG